MINTGNPAGRSRDARPKGIAVFIRQNRLATVAVLLALLGTGHFYLRDQSRRTSSAAANMDVSKEAKGDGLAIGERGNEETASGVSARLEQFEKRLAEWDTVSTELFAEYETIYKAHPELLAFTDYADRLRSDQAKRNIEGYKKALEWQAKNPEAFETHYKSVRLLGPARLLHALESPEEIDGTSLGTLLHELLQKPEYLEGWRARIAKIETEVFGEPGEATRIQGITRSDELIRELASRTSLYEAKYREIRDQTLPHDEAIWAYCVDSLHHSFISDAAESYAKSWTSHLKDKESEFNRLQMEIGDSFQHLSIDSPDKSEMVSRWLSFQEKLQSKRNQLYQ